MLYDPGINVILSPSASLRTGFAKNLKIVFEALLRSTNQRCFAPLNMTSSHLRD